MKVFFDTSVLVAGLVEAHPFHDRAFLWMEKANSGRIEPLLSAHSYAETYSVLTKLPLKTRISPGMAYRLISMNLEPHFKAVSLSPKEYTYLIREAAVSGVKGGTVFDCLIGRAALKAGVDTFLTFNLKDFGYAVPELAEVIQVP